MKIAVLSGKGGTGKTLVSVNLAAVIQNSLYADCDVEEPNGYLFFKPENLEITDISVKLPVVNHSLCNGCRKCVDFCRFNALAFIGDRVHTFDNICHSCGGCMMFCPTGAITERDEKVGEVQIGSSEDVKVITGIIKTGKASGTPVISAVLKEVENSDRCSIIDCPPGSACVVMESIKDADYCILVAEPTIFGAHNLKMVYDLVKLFKKPHGVVLNKCLEGENPSEQFCIENNIKILDKIYFDHELGKLNSNGFIVSREDKKYRDLFIGLLEKVKEEVSL